MEACSKLEYVPMRERSIRLLKIHPELQDHNVACTLNQYDNKIPPYNALSYRWGSQGSQEPESQESTTRKVYVNNTLISVHEPLWEFLDQMQQLGRTDDWIWIDFLCLNQRDHTEMSQQIHRMGDIYSEAKTTISWLGCKRSSGSQQNLEEAFVLIANKVAKKRVAVEKFFAQPNLNRWTDVRKRTQHEYHVLDVLSSSKSAATTAFESLPKAMPEVVHLGQGLMIPPILSILSSPYWERAWVTQEVALSQRVILMFGEAILDFDDLFLAYRSYFYYMMRYWKPLNGELRVPIEARAALQENSITFQQVMQWGRDCKASRDVDRIYGLLGLLQRCGDGIDALPPVLTGATEYGRGLSEVYWEIALTYRPLKDSSIVDNDQYKDMLERWMRFVCRSAEFFSCSFSTTGLQYAASERASQSCRNKARTALRVVKLCKSAIPADFSIEIRPSSSEWRFRSCESSWPTKPCARRLWLEADTSRFRYLQNLLGALFIETSESQCMGENEEYQAVYMGLQMLETDDWEGAWECEPRQSMEGPVIQNRSVRFECQVDLSSRFSGLPCSLNSGKPSASPFQESHQCKTQDRYLAIQSTGWTLSFVYQRTSQQRGYHHVLYGHLIVDY